MWRESLALPAYTSGTGLSRPCRPEAWRAANHNVSALLLDRVETLGQMARISTVDVLQWETHGNSGTRVVPAESAVLGIRGAREDRHVGQLRRRILEELQAFPPD